MAPSYNITMRKLIEILKQFKNPALLSAIKQPSTVPTDPNQFFTQLIWDLTKQYPELMDEKNPASQRLLKFTHHYIGPIHTGELTPTKRSR